MARLFFARYEASELGSTSIQTEHVLIGLLRECYSGRDATRTANRILALSDLSPEDIRQEIENRVLIQTKQLTSIEIHFSDQTERVLQFAAEEADQLWRQQIGVEHLLLGLLREDQSVAALVLTVGRLTLSAAKLEALA